jgi:hypothetical protein
MKGKLKGMLGRGKVTIVAVVVALVLVTAPVALAADGQPFILGKAKNTATKVTGLIGKVASGSALMVKNPSGGTALDLRVNAGQAPMTVNSNTRVANLNVSDSAHADNADNATNAQNAVNADNADNATNAQNAVNADNAGRLDGIDSTELTRAPRIKDITGSYSADFSSSPTTVCKGTTDYVAPRPQHAIVHVRTSANPSGAFLAYGLRGAFSTNGGSTWLETAPAWFVESSGNPGERVVNTYTGHLDLNAGTSYRFGANLYRTAGTGTIGFGYCAVTVEIVDRNPSASTFSTETVGGRKQP